MELPELGGLLVGFAGHLIADEGNRFRRYLLYFFARYIEVPLLWATYHVCRGPARFLTRFAPTRHLLGVLIAYPIAHWVDTGVPTPLKQILDVIERQADAIAVGPCRCRSAHRRCGHPIETDIVIRTGTDAWLKAFPRDYRIIDKKEAADIVRSCADLGMFHMLFVHCIVGDALNEYVICNCCTDGCSPYLANVTFGERYYPLIAGDYIAGLDEDLCESCGKCLEVCPWDVRRIADGVLVVDLDRCKGCGLCARACDKGAVTMRVKPERLPLRTYQEADRSESDHETDG